MFQALKFISFNLFGLQHSGMFSLESLPKPFIPHTFKNLSKIYTLYPILPQEVYVGNDIEPGVLF